jgi:hypothetical protein
VIRKARLKEMMRLSALWFMAVLLQGKGVKEVMPVFAEMHSRAIFPCPFET